MTGALKVRTATGPDVWTVVGGNTTGRLKARTATGPDVWTPVGTGTAGVLKVRTATGPDVWTPVVASGGVGAVPVQAVGFDASGDSYSRSCAGLTGNDVTVGGWFYLDVDRNAFTALFAFDPAAAGNYISMGTDGTGTTSHLNANTDSNSGGAFTVGAWYYVALVWTNSTGSNNAFHIAAVGAGSFTTTAVGGSDTIIDAWTFYIGNNRFSHFLNGRAAQVRVWSAALNTTELLLERASRTVVRTSNLWAAYSFASGPQTSDDSGNGRTLTAAGTLTSATGPPI